MTKMTGITPSVPEKMLTIDGHESSSQMSFFQLHGLPYYQKPIRPLGRIGPY